VSGCAKRPNVSLYLVTDPKLTLGRSEAEIVEAACKAGVTLVQYRDKDCDDETYTARGRELAAIARKYDVPLLLNDRVHLVKAIGADGIHLGQSDMPLAKARETLGRDCIIGVSASDAAQAKEAEDAGADYVAVSGVFYTDTKTDISRWLGLEGVTAIAKAVTVPVVAIGGIKAGNAAQIVAAGADGVAVVTAITMAEDIAAATRELAEAARQGSKLRTK